MSYKQVKPGSRRFARHVLRAVLGRAFGKGRAAIQAITGIQTATTSATPVTLTLSNIRQHDITTDNSGVARVVNIGSTADFIGQRKLVRLVTRADASDSFTMDAANIAQIGGSGPPRSISSITFNAAGQQALFEWNGSRWLILHTTAVVA